MTNKLEMLAENVQTRDVEDSLNRESFAYRAGRQTATFIRGLARYTKRYGVAELAATAASTGIAKVVYDSTESESAAALSSNIAGYAAFFGTIVTQEIRGQKKKANEKRRKFGIKDAGTIALNMVKEFGVSTYVDLCLTKPSILNYAISQLGAATGGFVGKWAADIPFWVMSDISNRYGEKVTKYVHKMKGGVKAE